PLPRRTGMTRVGAVRGKSCAWRQSGHPLGRIQPRRKGDDRNSSERIGARRVRSRSSEGTNKGGSPTGVSRHVLSRVDGAALGKEAFSSQVMLNHVLEEELLHQRQKTAGLGANVSNRNGSRA